ncbi:hypothetical protein OPW41_12955 [Vibrio europaeus]|nr:MULTISPECIES: hypothetical protein [Vibrio oreintalis group]MDC5721734.1 hypothetical protein [Vibrio europaeus]MDC5757090.1 hypothetical protein [Vibrio europaeus]MDC5776401.1 hypothetical protein [Vibrio europaeus]MDC5795740.1 hypothetical protein [Vibrio europaeus]MDC5801683.1 hypothetical protein [Vibrio europaeus]
MMISPLLIEVAFTLLSNKMTMQRETLPNPVTDVVGYSSLTSSKKGQQE